jgi:hypothetical protein
VFDYVAAFIYDQKPIDRNCFPPAITLRTAEAVRSLSCSAQMSSRRNW